MTERERLVSIQKLEDMTFESFVYMVEREVDEKVTTTIYLRSFMLACYDAGHTTFSRYIHGAIWEYYGRVA
jgi:hypothetical protein